MKSKFIYPTKRNVFIGFLVGQALPILTLGYAKNYGSIKLWIAFELVILSGLCLWQIKPISEFDEREKDIVFKWKGYLVNYGLNVLIIPLVAVCVRPEIQAWSLYLLAAVPAYIVYVFCAMMSKKELGYFFYK
jgi:hypothetical protein